MCRVTFESRVKRSNLRYEAEFTLMKRLLYRCSWGRHSSLKDEEISFTDEGIILNDFNITDQDNNTASLDGSIRTKDYTDLHLNLRLKARNFQLLNTDEDDSELFYGKVRINTDASISGTLTQPKVQMQSEPHGRQ